jgi:hypothetical protein
MFLARVSSGEREPSVLQDVHRPHVRLLLPTIAARIRQGSVLRRKPRQSTARRIVNAQPSVWSWSEAPQ